eukprot:3419446-Pyramimonas_sp.AAC.1
MVPVDGYNEGSGCLSIMSANAARFAGSCILRWSQVECLLLLLGVSRAVKSGRYRGRSFDLGSRVALVVDVEFLYACYPVVGNGYVVLDELEDLVVALLGAGAPRCMSKRCVNARKVVRWREMSSLTCAALSSSLCRGRGTPPMPGEVACETRALKPARTMAGGHLVACERSAPTTWLGDSGSAWHAKRAT